jgi:hypothetical protein
VNRGHIKPEDKLYELKSLNDASKKIEVSVKSVLYTDKGLENARTGLEKWQRCYNYETVSWLYFNTRNNLNLLVFV